MDAASHSSIAGGVCNQDASLSLAQQGFVGDSIVDGPGLRCVLFCQGCPHRCPGCHNPETHPFTGGVLVGTEELYRRIRSYPLCTGVTFSGGEPFAQAGALLGLAKKLRAFGYELAAYTGYTFEQLCREGRREQMHFLSQLDILVDGLFLEAQKDLTLRFRGSANQRILRVQESLQRGFAVPETAERWVG
ncbi:anaerobic ribonucleoside-triphosphate reductase activating protein [Ruminococcaceae bacterium OttesenSCG-928-I18]|nr:anaerobic ribonucleoside-triphosphate reductase activating protein [Ruminococcaceae bacterium OttesenSCG-928-I18]